MSLALAIHNHQPVGNFGWIFADVYERAYRPLVELLERHPTVRLSLHYSGPLLQWFAAERPDFLERVRALVRRGQVELLGGGFYEPVLATLHERDRIAQLTRMADELEAIGGIRPRGAWLAERVWEPSLPTALVDAGYAWTIVDDVHLRAAGIPDEEHWSAYTTDDQGRRLTVFGTEQGLRYLIPFKEVRQVIEHLRAHATPDGSRLGMMGDDGEKFGGWPTTYEHCWGGGRWMERFFEALEENADWLTTVTPTDWLTRHAPVDRVYLPTSSYTEMTAWVLPPRDAIAFELALEHATKNGLLEARFLRGGFWRNFQRRYREINDLHKQMLRASDKVAAMAAGPARLAALDHLMQGQSNDCYWHGLFGGVYISHMRLATFEHLIAAEDIADLREPAMAGSTRSALRDVDVDGVDEAFFEAPGQVVTIEIDQGAAVAAWDIRAARHALTGVLRRRFEASHEKLISAELSGSIRVDGAPEPDEGGPGTGGVASIHEIVASKEAGLGGLLVYDEYERRSGLVHLLADTVTAEDFIGARFAQLADVLDTPYVLEELTSTGLRASRLASTGQLWIEKRYRLGGDRLEPKLQLGVTLENRSQAPIRGRVGIEWSLTMLGGGGNPAAYYSVGGERHPHDSRGQALGASIESGNEYLGIALTSELEPAGDIWWAPIDTISNSEAGFERVYQGSSLLLSWPLDLAPGEARELVVGHRVRALRDRTAEEGWS